MDILTILVFLTVFVLGVYLLKYNQNHPPGPPNIPVLGSIGLFRKFSNNRPHIVLFEEAKKYGNIMSFRLGNQLIVVLSGYDVISEALVKNADIFSSRVMPVSLGEKILRLYGGKGIISNGYGHEWRYLRRLTLQALRDFGVGKSSIEEKILVETEETSKHLDASGGRPTDIIKLMQNVIGNVIYGINFGVRYDFDDPQFEELIGLTSSVIQSSGSVDAFNFLPSFIAKLLSKKDEEAQQRRWVALKKIKDFISDQIDEHSRTFDPDNIRDFVDIYLQTVKENKEEQQDYLNKGNMLRVILDLFVAGSETTSTTLSWAFLYMAVYPDVQSLCHEELDKEFGGKSINWSDRGQLTYTMATLMEIQRVTTIAPLSLAHCTLRDTTIGGFNIPEKTVIIPSLYSAAMDTKHWNQPEKFNPLRFIGSDGQLLKNEALIPFSVGPRVCLGEPLARMELFLVFTNLLQRFLFRCESDNTRPSLTPRQYSVTNIPEPFKLRVYNRLAGE